MVDELRLLYDIEYGICHEIYDAQSITANGVRINSKGDRYVLDYPPCEAVDMPYPMPHSEIDRPTLRYPQKVGLDIVLVKFNRGRSWRDRTVDHGVIAGENKSVFWLAQSTVQVPLDAPLLSEEYFEVLHDRRSFEQARVDGKTLLPQHVVALTKFSHAKVGD